jgi:hypothetical protein
MFRQAQYDKSCQSELVEDDLLIEISSCEQRNEFAQINTDDLNTTF